MAGGEPQRPQGSGAPGSHLIGLVEASPLSGVLANSILSETSIFDHQWSQGP